MPAALSDRLSEIIETQAGVVSRSQAIRLGLPAHVIDTQVKTGRWQQLQWGVYAAFTGVPPRDAILWAAVLRAGKSAALSHHSAAELYRIGPATGFIHVTVPAGRKVVRAAGLVIHRSGSLERMRHPVLLPPRTRIEDTVLDLAAAAHCRDEAARWISLGCGARLTTADRLSAVAAARPRLSNRAELLAALADVGDGAQSALECRYVADVERPHGLPRAERQARALTGRRTRYRDNLYAAWGVCVELDGQAAHPDHERWSDHHRDNQAAALGVSTLRYSWADVCDRSCQVAAEVAAVLRRRGWPGPICRCGPDCAIDRPGGSRAGPPGFHDLGARRPARVS